MSKNTTISWTDHTFNPWWGCQKVSPGCANCYAEKFAHRLGYQVWGPTANYRLMSDSHWLEPLKWNAAAASAGITERVFCASMADVFDARGPAGERERLWALIRQTPNLIWQLLTKRPENWTKYLPADALSWKNVWLGFTAEDQHYYDLRSTYMRQFEHWRGIFFVSYEPALGPLQLPNLGKLPDWLIFGGETGPTRRACEEQWAAHIKRQCDQLGIAFFMKQMSARTPAQAADQIPAGLLVRNFPEGEAA